MLFTVLLTINRAINSDVCCLHSVYVWTMCADKRSKQNVSTRNGRKNPQPVQNPYNTLIGRWTAETHQPQEKNTQHTRLHAANRLQQKRLTSSARRTLATSSARRLRRQLSRMTSRRNAAAAGARADPRWATCPGVLGGK